MRQTRASAKLPDHACADHMPPCIQAFVSAMPRVRPHYAVKCNPDPVMLRVLAALGAGFDCASAGEVQAALQAGAGPEDIILAQACKRPVDLRVAAASNVRVWLPRPSVVAQMRSTPINFAAYSQ